MHLFEQSTSRPQRLPLGIVCRRFESTSIFPLKEIEKIENDLHRVATRCCQNNLLINPEKNKVSVGWNQATYGPTFPSLSFLGKTLKPVDSAKDLGVTLDSHLTYTSHISNLFSTCISKLNQTKFR